MADFAQEFSKLFKNGCGPVTDWSKPRLFDANNNDCYGAEAALMASLNSEAYNKFRIYSYLLRERTRYKI